MLTSDELNERGAGKLPGHLGILIEEAGESVTATLSIKPHHMAPNGYLHAGTVVTLALWLRAPKAVQAGDTFTVNFFSRRAFSSASAVSGAVK